MSYSCGVLTVWFDSKTADRFRREGGDPRVQVAECLKEFSESPMHALLARYECSEYRFCYVLYENAGGDEVRRAVHQALSTALESGQFAFEQNLMSGDDFATELLTWFMNGDTAAKSAYVGQLKKLISEDLPLSIQSNLELILEYQASEDDLRREVPPNRTETLVAEVLNKIHGLVGNTELKAYIDELEAMRPLLCQWRGEEQFPQQHLLFAIDPGNGCSTAAKLISEYLEAAKLYRTDLEDRTFRFEEMTFKYSESPTVDMNSSVSECKNSISYLLPGVAVIHIEQWIKLLDSPMFLEMLNHCFSLRHDIVFVFVVPYLDEGALSRIYSRLNDVLNIRTIRFPPHTDEDLTTLAKQNLKAFGIEWDTSCDRCFRHMLAVERSDQHFYGIQTVMKLTTQIALMKARNVASKRNQNPIELLTESDFDDFMDQDSFGSETAGLDQLESLVGLASVKQRVKEIVAFIKVQKELYESGQEEVPPCYHMMFTGNPGTGKTVVARIIGRIFRENGLLPVGDLLEVSRFDMVGEYIGQTGPKTVALCRSAMGSVLFIDEAYLLNDGADGQGRDYGKEALGALIAEMENKRNHFVVILAGYEADMERLFSVNSGLRDRVPHKLHFDNYSREELFEIFKLQISDKYEFDEAFLKEAEQYFGGLSDELITSSSFGNGRFVRNIVERVRIKAMLRQMGESKQPSKALQLKKVDLESALADSDIAALNQKSKPVRIGF